MAKFTLQTSIPVVGAAWLAIFWLQTLWDSFSDTFLHGIGLLVFTMPFVGTLLALLCLDVVIAWELPWERATEWHHFCHESTQGALLVVILTLPWLLVVGSFGMFMLFGYWLGAAHGFHAFLNLLAKIPVVGMLLASLLALLFILVGLGMFSYVAWTGFIAGHMLYEGPRSGFVQNGMPLSGQQTQDDDVEGAQFGEWESNRG